MRVLLLCNGLTEANGWSRYSAVLAGSLRAAGHAVIACCPRGTEGDAPVLPPPLRMLSRPWLAWTVARRVAALVRREKIDVVHVTVEPYALMCAFLPADVRAKMVLTIHGNYGVRPLAWWMSRRLAIAYYQAIPRFVTVSAYTKKTVEQALREIAGTAIAERFAVRATVIVNRIALPPWNPPVPKERSVLFVGVVRGNKGVRELLRGCAEYEKRRGKPTAVTIVGNTSVDPAYVGSLHEEAQRLGMDARVRIAGQIDEASLDAAYREAAAFVMPSITQPDTFEGYGIAYIEANARGVPVVGPDSGGAAEAIRDGETGYRVDPADVGAIAGALEKIFDDKAIRPDACRKWAERHDETTLAAELLPIYESLTR